MLHITSTAGGLHISVKDDDPSAREEYTRLEYLLKCYGPYCQYAEKWHKEWEKKEYGIGAKYG